MADNTSAERKTPAVQKTEFETVTITASRLTDAKKANVLNDYRSYTYNFTLAVLDKDDIANPENYMGKELKYVIAKSGGKGSAPISAASSIAARQSQMEVYDKYDAAVKKAAIEQQNNTSKTLDGFNANSPGRFDFFIENVEIDTKMAFSPSSSFTLPTGIKFEIVEPYSINGFFEALHVTSVAANYSSYTDSGFVLKVEFFGYNDQADLPKPRSIPRSSRYFAFFFNQIQVELTEKGTRYRCAGRPTGQSVLGSANQTKEPISAEGKTVKEILEDLFKKRNDQLAKSDKLGKTGSSAQNHDIYEIKFPSIIDGKEVDTDNEMASAKIADALKENQLYSFPDPGTSTKSNALQTGKSAASSTPADYVMKNTQVQLPEGRQLSEAITAMLRDSSYARDILRNIKGNTDAQGFVKYFLVETEVTLLKTYDDISKRQHMKYTYKVLPYKIHFSKIPMFVGTPYSAATLDPLCWRKYNYIYTGKNIDIINFKLDFNFLYTASMPNANANNDTLGAKTAAAPDSTVVVKNKPIDKRIIQADENPTAMTVVDASSASLQLADGSAGQISDDPYWALARHMHSKLIESDTGSLMRGDLEIIGDPFYLVTGGIGNFKTKEEQPGITTDGEASYNRGEVLIRLDFRNPIDIGTLAEGGLLKFDEKKVPFGGVYMVTKVISTFRDGQFKQVLSLIRQAGQVEPNSTTKSDTPANRTETSADSLETVKTDTAKLTPAPVAVTPSFIPAALTNPLTAVTSRIPSIPTISLPDIKLPVLQPPAIAPMAELSIKDVANASNFLSGLASKAAEMAAAVNSNPLKSALNNVTDITSKFKA